MLGGNKKNNKGGNEEQKKRASEIFNILNESHNFLTKEQKESLAQNNKQRRQGKKPNSSASMDEALSRPLGPSLNFQDQAALNAEAQELEIQTGNEEKHQVKSVKPQSTATSSTSSAVAQATPEIADVNFEKKYPEESRVGLQHPIIKFGEGDFSKTQVHRLTEEKNKANGSLRKPPRRSGI